MNTNISLVSDAEKAETLNTIKNIQKNKEYSVGFKKEIIPQPLKTILPLDDLFLTKGCEGIYVIFFPHNNSVYIGQSVNISREVSMLKGGFRSQPLVNEAFSKSKDSYIALSILQGPGLKDKETRLNLEKMIINYAGHSSLNIIGKNEIKTNPLLCDPSVKRAQFNAYSLSCSKYGLKYSNIHEKKKGGCIYIFMHSKTGNFYIGESSDFYGTKVLRRHRATIAQIQELTLQNQTVKCSNSYHRILNDILTSGTDFFYSIIEYTCNLSPQERKKKEAAYIIEAEALYDSRLYNPPSLGVVANEKK